MQSGVARSELRPSARLRRGSRAERSRRPPTPADLRAAEAERHSPHSRALSPIQFSVKRGGGTRCACTAAVLCSVSPGSRARARFPPDLDGREPWCASSQERGPRGRAATSRRSQRDVGARALRSSRSLSLPARSTPASAPRPRRSQPCSSSAPANMSTTTASSRIYSDGYEVDGSWVLRVYVTDLSVERSLRVKGELHIGGVMLRLVEDLGKHYLNI